MSTRSTLAQTRRGTIEYVESGEGPAVLALHGAMGGYDQSDILARTVGGPSFRFLAISRPGYLGTPLSVGRSPEEQADAFADFMDVLGVEKTVVMAISGGGPSAIAFGLRHRDRCRGLVLISTCGGIIHTRIPLSFRLMQVLMRWPAVVKWMRAKTEKNLERNLSRSIADPDVLARTLQDPEVRLLLEELTVGMFDGAAQRLAGTSNDIEVTRTRDYPLEQIAIPVLVVHGTKDRIVPFEEHGKVLAARIPGAELLAVEGGEHVTIFTHRDVVRARVVQFLQSLD